MPKSKHYARIAITLPEKDLQAADRLARAQDRSRSWVIAEAVRRFASQQAAGGPEGGAPSRVAEPTSGSSGSSGSSGTPVAGLGSYRLDQLQRDMKLTPEQRVLAAEETLHQVGPLRPRRHHVLAFDRYEDFLDWKKFSGIRR